MRDVFELSPLDRRNRKLTEEKDVNALVETPDDERKLKNYGYRCRIRPRVGPGEYVQFILDDEDFVGIARCKYKACDSYGNYSGEKDRCGKAVIEIFVD